MRDLVLEQVRGLAGALAVLEARVRAAVAGEVSRAVAVAVGEVLAAVLGGRPGRMGPPAGPPARYPAGPPAGYGRDEWDGAWDEGDAHSGRPGWSPADRTGPPHQTPGAALDPAAAAAVVLALAVARWWRARHGSRWGTTGIALAAAGGCLAGGPVVHRLLGLVGAAHRLLAATDALGAGARALDWF